MAAGDADQTVPFPATQVFEAVEAEGVAATPADPKPSFSQEMDAATPHYSPMPQCKRFPDPKTPPLKPVVSESDHSTTMEVKNTMAPASLLDEEAHSLLMFFLWCMHVTSHLSHLSLFQVEVTRKQQLQAAADIKADGPEESESEEEPRPWKKPAALKRPAARKRPASKKSGTKEAQSEEDAKEKKTKGQSRVKKAASPKNKATPKKQEAQTKTRKRKSEHDKTPKVEKPKRKGKAVASPKKSPKKAASPKKSPDKSKKDKKVKATFARRLVPKFDPSRTFHTSVRAAFEKIVQDKVRFPSRLEDLRTNTDSILPSK